MTLLGGVNINIRHFSVMLGHEQRAKVESLQKVLGSQTTPMGKHINVLLFCCGGVGEGGGEGQVDRRKQYLHCTIRRNCIIRRSQG